MKENLLYVLVVLVVILFVLQWLQRYHVNLELEIMQDKYDDLKEQFKTDNLRQMAYFQSQFMNESISNSKVFDLFTDEINLLHDNKISKEDLSLVVEELIKLYLEDHDER